MGDRQLKDAIKHSLSLVGCISKDLRSQTSLLKMALPFHKMYRVTIFMFFILIVTGCSQIYDYPESSCEEIDVKAIVDFVYDYNLSNADRFSNDVGSVYLYVFNQDGLFLNRISKHRDFTREKRAYIELTSEMLEEGHSYYLLAMAMGNYEGYESSLIDEHAFELVNEMTPGVSTYFDYAVRFDRDNNGVVDYKDYMKKFGNDDVFIDTLWSTRPGTVAALDIPNFNESGSFVPSENAGNIIEHATIELMRITNTLEVKLSNDGFTANSDLSRYLIVIDFPYGNGTIMMNGSTEKSTQSLQYRSLRKRMMERTPDITRNNEGESYWDLCATFGLSRLQTTDESRFRILDTEKGITLVDEDFVGLIAPEGMSGIELQDFLDRAYDFSLTFSSPDEEGKYTRVRIDVDILSWVKRLQSIDL